MATTFRGLPPDEAGKVLAKETAQRGAKIVFARKELAGTLDEAVTVLCRYVHFAHVEQAYAVALWAAATHRYDDFDIFARLGIRAATKGSGKTRLLEVTRPMVHEGWGPVVGPSAAALYRYIADVHPTILLDEVDRMFEKRAEDNAAILEVINAGHIRGGFVPRVVGIGTKQRVEPFDVYTPIALAGIAVNWPDTVLDRSIVVTLEKRKASEPIERFRRRDHAVPGAVGARLAKLMPSVEFEDVELPEFLSDRAQDNWEALFMVAQAAGGHWAARAKAAAHVLGTAAAELLQADERDEVQLLGDIVFLFEREDPSSGFMGSTELVNHLTALEDRPWADWPGAGFTTNRMARLLRRLDIKPVNPFGSTKRGYERETVESVWDRLGTRSATSREARDE